MKTIKIIDLLNKIAKGEEVPEKIKYDEIIYIKYNDGDVDYYCSEGKNSCLLLEQINNTNYLNDEVEIIEEVEEDKFEDIEEIKHKYIYGLNAKEEMIDDRITEFEDTINSLIKNQKKIIEQLKNKD